MTPEECRELLPIRAGQSHLDAAFTSSGSNGKISPPYDPRVRPDKPHRRQAAWTPSPIAIGCCLFRSFHRMAETRPSPISIVGAVPSSSVPPGQAPRWRFSRREFRSFRLAGFLDGPALTVEITAPPLDVSNPPSHTPLRSEKHDSGKMEKHNWRQFFGDFSCYVGYLACRIPIIAGSMPILAPGAA
jgi:hypothetical protein